MDFSNLTGKELYSDEVIAYVMDEEDPLIREQLGFDGCNSKGMVRNDIQHLLKQLN